MGWTRPARRIEDDAGIVRAAVNPRMRRALREAGPRARGRVLSARSELDRSFRKGYVVMAAFSVVFLLLSIKSIVQTSSWWVVWCMLVFMVLQPSMMVLAWWFGTPVRKEEIRRVALEHELCPACGGDLAGAAPAAETGRVRCACGAEWRQAIRLFESRCGGCGYDMTGLAPEEAGMLRCPECGAGWRVGEARLGAAGMESEA
jgi:hypothetical protein